MAIQLTAAPPATPERPSALSIRAMADPIFVDSGQGCVPDHLDFAVDKGTCTEPVEWSVDFISTRWLPEYAGTIVGSDTTAVYLPPMHQGWFCDAETSSIKVAVHARACGQTARSMVAFHGFEPPSAVVPDVIDVEAGAPGFVELSALTGWCPAAPPSDPWSLTSTINPTRLTQGPGTIEVVSGQPLRVRYRPPATIAPGTPVVVTLRASIPDCSFEGEATIRIHMPSSFRWGGETPLYAGDTNFGAGITLDNEAILDARGFTGTLSGRIPMAVLGSQFDFMSWTNEATINPRLAGSSSFFHHTELFGLTTSTLSLQCPDLGTTACSAGLDPLAIPIVSDLFCYKGGGRPATCRFGGPAADKYEKYCSTDLACSAFGLRCINNRCTKGCDTPNDCGAGAMCGDDPLTPAAWKLTAFAGPVPFTLEGKFCLAYGVAATIGMPRDLLGSRLEFGLKPTIKLTGSVTAAVGVPGLLAAGVRGKVDIADERLAPKLGATVRAVPLGTECPLEAGCIIGSLDAGIENTFLAAQGGIYLFADHPWLTWCNYFPLQPCIGIVRSEYPWLVWGAPFYVINRCLPCLGDDDCRVEGLSESSQGTCVAGQCSNAHRGFCTDPMSALVSQ